MKEKPFGKESKTQFLNFKSVTNVENKKSLQTDQTEKYEHQNKCKKTELLPETEKTFFGENERNDLNDAEILRNAKKLEKKAKLLFQFLNQ